METYDFIYELKKALNLRIFSNPATTSDFMDIIHDVFNKSFNNHMTYFNYDDTEHEVTMSFTYDNNITMNPVLDESIRNDRNECVYKFCSLYVTTISLALNDLSGREYAHQFEDYMLGQYKKMLGQICYTFSWVRPANVLNTKMRLY